MIGIMIVMIISLLAIPYWLLDETHDIGGVTIVYIYMHIYDIDICIHIYIHIFPIDYSLMASG